MSIAYVTSGKPNQISLIHYNLGYLFIFVFSIPSEQQLEAYIL